MTVIYEVYKAQSVGEETVPDTHIHIEIPIRDVKTLEEGVLLHEDGAELLFKALKYSLPGGTFDRLLAKMLTYKASHFVIPHEKED